MNVLFLGGARFKQPLDPTSEKKFCALKTLGHIFVVGFSQDLRPRHLREPTQFYLLPKLSLPVFRYLTMFTVGPVLTLCLVLRHGITVLVAQSPYEGLLAALVKKVANWFGHRVALVVESHGDFEESLFLQRRVLFPGLYRFLMRHAARFALKHADLLRAVSDSTKKQLEQWAPGKPILQFATWTNVEVFLAAGAKEDEGISQSILFAGVLIPRKGVHHLINAFGLIALNFPETSLVIVGREENRAYAGDLKEQVRRLGFNGRVHFVGEVGQAELAEWMRRACAFVLPTYSEGLPRVIFEAMAAGLPVIASAVSGIPEVVEDGVTGFLVPLGDEPALVGRLRWLLSHPREAKEMGRHARACAEKFFSTENYIQSYRRIFEHARKALEGQQTNATSAIQPRHGYR